MARRLAFAFAAALALGGCCQDIKGYVPPSNARVEFGPIPKPKHVKRVRSGHSSKATLSSSDASASEHELAKLEPHSKEWDSALDALNQAADDELRKKLVICRGCDQRVDEDQTSAVWPTRAADGYLSLQRTLGSLALPEAAPSGGPRKP
ncbi:hypothetical protein [Bradyrhizobium sp.]|uniref:hypothetical protein n=1 Tax=Bradyrhizobium sp. TaxID=376 RepID=UPI003C7CE242